MERVTVSPDLWNSVFPGDHYDGRRVLAVERTFYKGVVTVELHLDEPEA